MPVPAQLKLCRHFFKGATRAGDRYSVPIPRGKETACLLRRLDGADSRDQHGSHLEQVTADSVVRKLKDGSRFVLIYSDEVLRVLHASLMLDRAGDAQSHIHLG